MCEDVIEGQADTQPRQGRWHKNNGACLPVRAHPFMCEGNTYGTDM